MSAFIKFISTRPNTNTDFWWTSADTAITEKRNQVVALASQAGIPFEMTTSPDNLTLTSKYTVESQEQWAAFTASISAAVPTLTSSRTAYFQANGHGLKFEAVDADTNQVIKEVNIV